MAAPPLGFSAAGWLALAPFFAALRGKAPSRGFALGFLYGVLISAAVAHWLWSAISAYFAAPAPLASLLTVLAYGLYVGVYTALAAGGCCLLNRRGGPAIRWIAAPALWTAAEFARSSLFSGFSWELLGYTQYRNLGIIQIADATGVYGVSFLMALSGYAAAELAAFAASARRGESARESPWLALACVAAALGLVRLYGGFRLRQWRRAAASPAFEVALVRAKVPGENRWRRERYGSTLAKYARLTAARIARGGAGLVVWPEFALGFYLDGEVALRAQLGALARSLGSALLLGAPRSEESGSGVFYYNSAYLITAKGELQDTYDKIRLLPFAEYRPAPFQNLMEHTRERPSAFTPGRRSTVFRLPQAAFGVLICYEATYPDLARRLVSGGAQFLVNISNEAWLIEPGGAAALQQFSMAVFRAVENRRTLAASATQGVSAFVDPDGTVRGLSAESEGVIIGKVSLRRGLTMYTRWGDWFAWMCVLIAVTAPLAARTRSARA